MGTSVTFNGTSYTIPASGELNWSALSNFLIDVGQHAALSTSGIRALRVALTTPVTVSAANDYAVVCKLSSPGAVAVTLPAGVAGQIFVIHDGTGDAASNNITITPNGAETINGAATRVLSHNRGAITLQYSTTGSDWKVTDEFYPSSTIVNADVSTTAAIAYSKLAALTSAHILVGSAGNVATDVAVTGDITIDNAGVTAIGTGKVTSTMILDGTILNADINASAAIDGSKIVSATGSTAGVINGTTQSMAGVKTFSTQVIGHGTGTNDDAAAGYIGEYIEAKNATPGNVGTSAQRFDIGSITLSAGDWDVYGHVLYTRNGATFSSTDLELGISGTTGNSSTGLSDGVTNLYQSAVVPTTFSGYSMSIGPIRMQSDGTNLYLNGTTISSSQVVYLKGYVSAYSVATPQKTYLIRARRVR